LLENTKKTKIAVYRGHSKAFDGWLLSTVIISGFVIAPLAVILFSFLSPSGEIWTHLMETVLTDLLINTVKMVSGVFAVTLVLGVSLAWLTAACNFPGRQFFSWVLLLPMAIPTYVFAFVGLGLFDFTGPVQTKLRLIYGPDLSWFPNFRSTGGVITIMSLALYPYVYLLARNAFITQGRQALEAAQMLGYSRVSGFFRVSLPLARPWIVGGSMLVIMEALADFGAVSIFNYTTFTTAIYKAWFGLFSLSAAAQLSSILVVFVLILFLVEQKMRSRMLFTQAGRQSKEVYRIELQGFIGWGSFFFCGIIFFIAFVLPIGQLLVWSLEVYREEFDGGYGSLFINSLLLGLMGAFIISFCALLLSYSARRRKDKVTRGLVRIATLGYALPGTVLAVGIFIPISFFDDSLIYLQKKILNMDAGPLLQGTVVVMMIAYLVRFMSPAFLSVNSAMERVRQSLDDASRVMGLKGPMLLLQLYLPVLKGGILTAATIVLVDIMKEMPITLMTRPFGWDTLSVKIFELTSEGEWERAAIPAITLVLTSLIPVIFLTSHSEKE